jgi:hypothetical protein
LLSSIFIRNQCATGTGVLTIYDYVTHPVRSVWLRWKEFPPVSRVVQAATVKILLSLAEHNLKSSFCLALLWRLLQRCHFDDDDERALMMMMYPLAG